MADLPATGGAHRPGFANRIGGEVVVMQVGLLVGWIQVVHLLGIAGGAQGGGGQHLGETPLEQARAVHPAGQHANG